MRVLVACEESQEVMKRFRAVGHDAYSCDIQACSGGMPEYHLQADVSDVLRDHWDMVIAFPPCTHLACSGARWFKEKSDLQRQAIEFFLMFTRLSCLWAIENPVGIMSTLYRKPDQIIQPYQFGHGETKRTCLWLNGLPGLMPDHLVSGRLNRIHKMPPSVDRGKLRSKTYPGIADAMVKWWS